jgi:hypothetical protein
MEKKDGSSRERAKFEKLEMTESSQNPVCSLCGRPATESVDGEPSCRDHVEQVYEHQVEDYTRKHLSNNAWREV